MRDKIHIVLVPAGAEFKAVKRGLSEVLNPPQLVAIPAGPKGLKTFLRGWKVPDLEGKGLLLMGLGGSLSVGHEVGKAIALRKIWNAASDEVLFCDHKATEHIVQQLGIFSGVGVSCDRVITLAKEKQQLGDRYSADVVDMESAVLLQTLSVPVAIVRVVSDDCGGDLPDIESAITPNGSLKPLQIALSFARKPQAAIRLVRGSLIGLKQLEQLVCRLF
ncbi:MAG: hypothetical protein AAF716_00480 [Cyanobacteria bacterium P01_D01_bin.1]